MIWLRSPLSRAALLAAAVASLLVACGGKVVVEADGVSGGGGATTATISSSVGSSGNGGVGAGGCEGLQADVVKKVAAAQACNPVLSVPQCSGMVTTVNLCGCPIVANDSSSMVAENATSAFKSWVSAGCGPFDCDNCPPGPGSAWYCDPTTAVCKPAFEK